MMRGRKRARDGDIIPYDYTAADQGEPPPGYDKINDTPSMPIKPAKRFECTFEGCGRTYSRAEHLQRHQLNHNPKEISRCDYPGCTRTFVRQDLCMRHRERHVAHAKQTNSSPPKGRSNSHTEGDKSESRPVRSVGRPRLASLQQPQKVDLQSREQHQPPILPPSVPPLDPHQSNREHHLENSVTSAFDGFGNVMEVGLSETRAQQHQHQPPPPPPPERTNTGPLYVPQANNTTPREESGFPEVFNDSPASIRDELTAWLFNEQNSMQMGMYPTGNVQQTTIPFMGMPLGFGMQAYNNYVADPVLENTFPDMTFPMITEQSRVPQFSPSNTMLSQKKRLLLIELMEYRLSPGGNPAVQMLRQELFQGNRDADDHILSMRAMQQYIGSYWYHFHCQLPILHQPTFSADDTHEYVLLAVMAIGASYLNKAHGQAFTEAAGRFANFIAWHLRWQVFMDNDFQPPAKLWVFQTLLLLEVFEKTNSTRALHERAHMHCNTTISLIRRGTALTDDASTEMAQKGRSATTPEEWWNRWITTEATRRAAFAAFILDSTHAVMFGHAASMVVHEVHLPLPCDDTLWSANSPGEVSRVEASLHFHGIKPLTFLEGLKKILSGRKVKTNPFGRMILMAGLLSVSWHLHQRDVQVSTLGVTQTLGVPGGWRESLAKAFDFWKKDFDESMSHIRMVTPSWQNSIGGADDLTISTSADVLHHLSHVTLHIDVLDCQIFAGATKLFGRPITSSDYEKVKYKLTIWARSSGARSAVYHALQLIKSVVLDTQPDGPPVFYNARDDHLLNRPWALYYSVLTVWSYGYALDGPLNPFPFHLVHQHRRTISSTSRHTFNEALSTPSHSGYPDSLPTVTDDYEPFKSNLLQDAKSFLMSVGSVKTPEDLSSIKRGRNNVVGLLGIFQAAFRVSRWELLHEAAERLNHAIWILKSTDQR